MKWYQKTFGIIVLLIVFFPVGLYFMWKYANWNKIVKIAVSCFFCIVIVDAIVNPSSSKDSGNITAKNYTDQPDSVSSKSEEPKADESENQKSAEEAEQDRLAEEAEKQRLAEEAEQKRLAEEAEQKRLAEEAEKQRLAEEAEKQRLAEEAEKQRLAEEAEKQRLAEEAEKQRLAEEAEQQRLAEAEKQRLAEENRKASLVWVDDTSAKYHRKNGCGMDNAYQVSLQDAEAMGKEPCGRCYR